MLYRVTNRNTYIFYLVHEKKRKNDVDDHVLHVHTHLNKCRHELKRCAICRKRHIHYIKLRNKQMA